MNSLDGVIIAVAMVLIATGSISIVTGAFWKLVVIIWDFIAEKKYDKELKEKYKN